MYETERVQEVGRGASYRRHGRRRGCGRRRALENRCSESRGRGAQQVRDLEKLWYQRREGRTSAGSPQELLAARSRTSATRYEVEALAAKYEFTGRQGDDGPRGAGRSSEELEMIDRPARAASRGAGRRRKIAVIDHGGARGVRRAGRSRPAQRQLQQQVQRLPPARWRGTTGDRAHRATAIELTPKAYPDLPVHAPGRRSSPTSRRPGRGRHRGPARGRGRGGDAAHEARTSSATPSPTWTSRSR